MSEDRWNATERYDVLRIDADYRDCSEDELARMDRRHAARLGRWLSVCSIVGAIVYCAWWWHL